MSKIRETFITMCRYTDGEDGWELFSERAAHQRQFTRMFGKPHKTRGEGMTWIIPYKSLSIRKRKQTNYTDEQKRVIAERFKQSRSKQS